MDELTLFIELLKIDNPALRRARLDEVAGNDIDLRTRIDELLEAHLRASKFMDTSAHLNGLNVTSPAARDLHHEQPGDVIGPYKLLQVIGEGGMGSVFMAEQTKPVQRRVALKIIKAGMDSKSVIARFEAERQALAMMDHPNIAKVLDAGSTSAGHPFFVMELVKGVEITKYCDEKRLNVKKRLELFISVCQAIQHAHQKGVIHRDIKPSNVLVAQYDGTPVPKVIDFGVAKATAQKLTEKTLFTEFGQVIGTIEYMSPEQAELNQLDIDTRSDVYSLGVLLYELLTGSTPLDGKQLRSVAYIEMLRMIREEEPSKPSAKVSTSATLASIAASRGVEPERLGKIVKGELDWIVMKALEKDRSRRYATSSLLAEDIGRYLNNEQILACPASLGYRLRKMTWKHRAALATAALVMMGLAVGLGIATWQAIRAIHAEQLAESRFRSESEARDLADKATINAMEAARNEQAAQVRATQLATDSRIQLARSHVAAGAKYMAERKFGLAFQMFVEALRVNEKNNQPTSIDRLRIGMVLQQCPKPMACFQLGPSSNRKRADLLFDHRGIAIGFKYCDDENKSLQVFEIQSGKPISIVFVASGRIEQANMSPDGRLLLAKSDNQMVWLWEINSGRLVFSRAFELGSIVECTFSEKSDRLALLHFLGNTQIVDTSNGHELATIKTPIGVNWPTFSPDGTKLLLWSGGDTPRIQVWDEEHGIRTGGIFGHSRFLTGLRFSHDGKRIVTASFDSTARVWDAQSLVSLTPPMEHDDGVEQAFFSADDSSIITASLDKTTKIWDSKTGSLLTAPLNHDSCVRIAASSHDGTLLVTAGDDATARVWNPDSSKLAYPVICHHQRVTYASFDKSGRIVMTATSDGLVQLWDLATTYPSSVVIDTHPANPHLAAFTPDSKNLFVGGMAPRLWAVDSGAFASPVMDHGWEANLVVVAPNGGRSATFNYGRGVKVWDLNSFEAVTPLLQLKRKTPASGNVTGDLLNDASFSQGAKTILGLWRVPSSRVGMWDTSTGTQLDWPVTREEDVTCIVYSPDGNFIASGSTNRSTKPNSGVLSLWDGSTGDLLHPRINSELPVSIVRFSPDSQRLATLYSGDGGIGADVRVWDIATGQEVGPGLFSELAFLDVVFNHDGSRIATANADHSIRVWNVATGKPLTPPMIHSEVVNSVSFSPDGTILVAACGSDNLAAQGEANVQLWDATTGQPISPPLHHPNQSLIVTSGRFSLDGHYIASSSRDKTTCIWALEECSLSSKRLVTLAEVLSGQRFDEASSFSSLNADELLAKWNEMAALEQHWFVASPKQTNAWKYHRAFELAKLKQWEAAIDYFDQLLTEVPSEMFGLHYRRFEAALATLQWDLAQEDLAAITRILGEGHHMSLVFTRNVADALFEGGLVFEATSLVEKWLPIARQDSRESDGVVLLTMLDIARNGYESNGEFDKAKSMLREGAALIRELIGQTRNQTESNPLQRALLLAGLGEKLLEQEEWSDSETALRECLTIRDVADPDLWTTFNAKLLLGTALLGQEKFDDAELLLAAGWEGVIRREQQILPVARPAFSRRIKRVAELYRALEKPEAAAAWQQKLDEFDGARPRLEEKGS